jgi:hypothetical protein
MKNLLFLSVACLSVTFPALAQTQTSSTQVPQTQPAYVNNSSGQFANGGLSFSNHLGQIFSADDLAGKLQNLRAAIDETLPVLAAFNDHFSNSVTTSQQTIGGTLSDIVSDVLHKNQSTGQTAQPATTTQSTFSTSNIVSVLHGLLNKNSSGTSASITNQASAQDLIGLQRDLQPALADLQRLNVGPSISPTSTPNPTGNLPEQQQYPNGSLTPTGR